MVTSNMFIVAPGNQPSSLVDRREKGANEMRNVTSVLKGTRRRPEGEIAAKSRDEWGDEGLGYNQIADGVMRTPIQVRAATTPGSS